MLSEKEIRKKVYELADYFKHYYQKKDWHRAKASYLTASTVAVFVQMSDEEKAELFGNRPYKDDREELIDGLFPERQVERVYLECIKRNDTYENLQFKKIQKNS